MYRMTGREASDGRPHHTPSTYDIDQSPGYTRSAVAQLTAAYTYTVYGYCSCRVNVRWPVPTGTAIS